VCSRYIDYKIILLTFTQSTTHLILFYTFIDIINNFSNGICDDSEYNSLNCGYDGGDCDVLHFERDSMALITPQSLDHFLYQNSELSFYFAGKMDTTNNDWGYFFDRSILLPGTNLYYGLWSYFYDDGDVVIGWEYDEKGDVEHKITCKNALNRTATTVATATTSTNQVELSRYVQFIVHDLKVSLLVDGMEQCSVQLSSPPIMYNEVGLYLGGALDTRNYIHADMIDVKMKYGNMVGHLQPLVVDGEAIDDDSVLGVMNDDVTNVYSAEWS
jgi:hypothetical protein